MQNIKRRYDRFFIMFKQELQGYSIDGREPNGYCKIEIRDGKGRANTYMQGLKPLKDGSMYRVYLIAVQGDKALGVSTGWLDIDNKGRGECRWEFNPDNLDGTGLAIEDFNVGAIILKGNNIKEMIAPIVGYKDKEVIWKNGFRDFSVYNEKKETKIKETINQPKTIHIEPKKEESNIEIIQHKVKEEPETISIEMEKEQSQIVSPNLEEYKEKVKKEDIEKENTEKEDIEKDINPHKIFNDMVNKFYAEMEELEKCKVLNSEDKKMLDLELKEPEKSQINDVDYMFNTNETLIPFEDYNKTIKWIKVAPFELVTLNLSIWTYIKHQFINVGWKKYKHLILGKYSQDNVCKYILGVPDSYNNEYVDIAKELGFKKFAPCKNKTLQKGSLGYWLMEL